MVNVRDLWNAGEKHAFVKYILRRRISIEACLTLFFDQSKPLVQIFDKVFLRLSIDLCQRLQYKNKRN